MFNKNVIMLNHWTKYVSINFLIIKLNYFIDLLSNLLQIDGLFEDSGHSWHSGHRLAVATGW